MNNQGWPNAIMVLFLFVVAWALVMGGVYLLSCATKVEEECMAAGWPDSRYFISGSYCLNAQQAVRFDEREQKQ